MGHTRFHFSLSTMTKILGCVFLFVLGCGPGYSDFSEKVGNGYYYYRTSPIDRFIAPKIWNDKTPIIPSKVVKYRKHDGYVTAKREIIQMGSSGSRVTSGTFDYWILNTATPVVYGPMDKSEFDLRVVKLSLSEKLALH